MLEHVVSTDKNKYRAVVLGVSTGGVEALKRLLPALPAGFRLPILIVIHLAPDSDNGLALLLDSHAAIRVKEADDGEDVLPSTAYLAPANYHLLVSRDRRLALSTDARVNYARPSVDELFESAATVYGQSLIGIVLSGASSDGARGLQRIKQVGGYAIVQAPDDAEIDTMPRCALALVAADRVTTLSELPAVLAGLAEL
jgi:two-component system chemotaxis response regulator CheB